MARHRTIKPEFFSSEQLAECSTNARLLFVGMWCFSDDGGVHPASAARLKMEVFPADAISAKDVGSYVQELLKQGLLESYVVDGKEFWRVTGWHHQKIDKPSYTYPRSREFGEYATSIRRGFVDSSPPEGKGEEGNGREGSGREANGVERRSMGDRKAIGGANRSVSPRSSRSPKDVSEGEEEPLDLSEVVWDFVYSMAEKVAKRVPPITPADRRAWLKYAVMAERMFGEGWLIDAVEATMRATKRDGTVQEYFIGTLTSKAADEHNVNEKAFLGIFRRIEIPTSVWKSPVIPVRGAK